MPLEIIEETHNEKLFLEPVVTPTPLTNLMVDTTE